MRRLVPAVSVSVALALGACGSNPAGALAGKSATQILSAAREAALHESSVVYEFKATTTNTTQVVSGEAGADSGFETVTTGAAAVEVELIGTTTYFQGNAPGLQQTLAFPAAQATNYAGKWIAVPEGAALFNEISQSVTMAGLLSLFTPSGRLHAGTPAKIAGREVIGVTGGIPMPSSASASGTAVLYVSTFTPTLPVGFSATATNGGQRLQDVGAFGRWGSPLHLAPPSSAIPFSSLHS
ncbi:MAG: hypothetical protein ACYDD4_14315 [Acidimicrobiales bacterium]